MTAVGHPLYALTLPARLTARYGLTSDGTRTLPRPAPLGRHYGRGDPVGPAVSKKRPSGHVP
ncbi:hypothetical protein ACH4FX_36505 [Streptomyces sp. NPDC018019]|uniref:hypothetical protein n=1 Tax=Streptomyces sp. NPDC018019 TaxID=3365030 RepID=UPI0037A1B7C5